jgi:hypothetical protein
MKACTNANFIRDPEDDFLKSGKNQLKDCEKYAYFTSELSVFIQRQLKML